MTVQRGADRPEGRRDQPKSPTGPRLPRKSDTIRSPIRGAGGDGTLPLDEADRVWFQRAGGLTLDLEGRECLRGLNREESIEYLELHRRGLDNDDVAFLRYILLGDRHVVATAKAGG